MRKQHSTEKKSTIIVRDCENKNSVRRFNPLQLNESKGRTMDKFLVIFDCDGVLVDSEIIACRIEAEELTRAGFPIDPYEDIRRFAGISQKDVFAIVEAELGHKLPEDFPLQMHEKILRALAEELQPIAGVKELLETGINKCIASSGSLDKIANSLKATGLQFYFSDNEIFSSQMVKRGKPEPDLFLYAAQKMAVLPEHCFVIEDSVYGIMAAKKAGMKAFGFVGASHAIGEAYAQKLMEAGADKIFSTMSTLPELIGEYS